MDKRKYQSKTLIAEYNRNDTIEDCMFKEYAYRLKDGSKIIEFDGAGWSIYGVKIGFNHNIPRKGVYSINNKEYKDWKDRRINEIDGIFIDWEEQYLEQLEMDQEALQKCVGKNDLQF